MDKLAQEDSHVQNLISKIESLQGQLGYIQRLQYGS